MARITITGYSDDNIEVDGDISEEWGFYPSDEKDTRLIAVSEGTLLRVNYDADGLWRVNRVYPGTAAYSKVEGSVADDTFDVVTLDGDIQWVALGTDYKMLRKLTGS